jgi:hypothetical protein
VRIRSSLLADRLRRGKWALVFWGTSPRSDVDRRRPDLLRGRDVGRFSLRRGRCQAYGRVIFAEGTGFGFARSILLFDGFL